MKKAPPFQALPKCLDLLGWWVSCSSLRPPRWPHEHVCGTVHRREGYERVGWNPRHWSHWTPVTLCLTIHTATPCRMSPTSHHKHRSRTWSKPEPWCRRSLEKSRWSEPSTCRPSMTPSTLAMRVARGFVTCVCVCVHVFKPVKDNTISEYTKRARPGMPTSV